jgi:hypothetical protein
MLKKTFGFDRVEVDSFGWCVTMDGKTFRTGSNLKDAADWRPSSTTTA